ncbi:MAG: two-component sensor histidine kinase [Sphingobium sp.]|uniref:sensor histidine kinase n=1 Tax=Sphingobium sp. TaxID=1912891 RepID=UPI000DB0B310|nr:HAMP domain-containing sensor histidine kinase [Sphingobium sp.]PZU07139.1 MAG: two-component sensor histidine kinase [Sphingobium sp.]
MMPRLQSLRGLTIAFIALFILVTAAAGFGTYFTTLSMITALVDERVLAESHAIAPPGTREGVRAIGARMEAITHVRDTADLGMLLTDKAGRPIAGNVRFSRPLPLGYSSLDRRDRIEGLSAGRVLVRDLGNGSRLAVFAETEPFDDYFDIRQRIYIGGFGAIILVVLVGLLLFRRLVGERIDQLRMAAESISDGDLSRRVPLKGDGGEFDRQAAAFNRMLDRIGQLMAEVRNVSNDIAHELRTPLARLRNELALLERAGHPERAKVQVQAALMQADQLLEMFAALLRISEIESGARRAGFQSVGLDEIARTMVDMARPIADEKGQSLTVGGRYAPVRGDPQLLAQMILNLVENAIRHTPPGTGIAVRVEAMTGGVHFVIEDDGPGIPAEQRQLVMRRFGRLDASRHERGHGLGLPLVGAIVRLHQGALSLENAEPGLRIVVTLPA